MSVDNISPFFAADETAGRPPESVLAGGPEAPRRLIWAWDNIGFAMKSSTIAASAATGGAIVVGVLLLWRRHLRRLEQAPILVKLGGSAITEKAKFETLNEAYLNDTASSIAASGRHTCVIHGAGSFGHFQAREHGVSKGTQHPAFSWLGFAATRHSVGTLNRHVVGALLRAGVAATALPPFPTWSTTRPRVPHPSTARGGADAVQALLAAGLTPVLHGDAVLDASQGASILSGDTLMVSLASALRPCLAVFLTDVAGVFTRPPAEPGAELLRRIVISRTTGAIVATSTSAALAEHSTEAAAVVSSTTAAHDVTGGLAAKLEAAATIAQGGTPVVIVQVGTPHAAAALRGVVPECCTLITTAGSRVRVVTTHVATARIA